MIALKVLYSFLVVVFKRSSPRWGSTTILADPNPYHEPTSHEGAFKFSRSNKSDIYFQQIAKWETYHVI